MTETRKTAAKKTAAPRKRAARKPVTPPAAPKVEAEHTPKMEQEEGPAVTETSVETTTEKKTRKPDPLLAAKRRLESARKRHAKALAKAQAVTDVQAELDASNAELESATEAFGEAVNAV